MNFEYSTLHLLNHQIRNPDGHHDKENHQYNQDDGEERKFSKFHLFAIHCETNIP